MTFPGRMLLVVVLAAYQYPAFTAQGAAPVISSVPSTLRDGKLWGSGPHSGDRALLVRAVDANLKFLQTQRAKEFYRREYLKASVTRPKLISSLRRFRQLLKYSRSQNQFYAALAREFQFVPLSSREQPVHFTAYYTPEYAASRTRTHTFAYPVFRAPQNLARWPRPHPPREQLEGMDGLQHADHLRGLEIAFLSSRIDAFLAQVQGAVRLRFPDGEVVSLGYAAATNHQYTSIGRELVRDEKIKWEELTLPAVREYLAEHPDELDDYLPRNKRFIFFRKTSGAARGALSVPLVSERSIATDKALVPPGALFLAKIHLRNPRAQQEWKAPALTRFLLDADSGSAIKGVRRVDLYTGAGKNAERRAGVVNSMGQMYLLLLKR